MTGQGPKSSAFRDHLAAMRRDGLIESAGGKVEITEAGRKSAPGSVSPPTLDELHDRWRSRLPASQARILYVLMGRYPDDATRERVA